MNDDFMDSAPIAKKTSVIFLVVDTSGDMVAERIHIVNQAIKEVLPIIRDISNKSVDVEIKIAIQTFDSVVNWITPNPVSLNDYNYKDIQAGGCASMGEAFVELNSKLNENAFLSSEVGNLAPAIILLSDTTPTDDYRKGLDALKQNKWYKSAIKVAFAISSEAEKDILEDFTGNKELVFEDGDNFSLKEIIKLVSVKVAKIGIKVRETTEEKCKELIQEIKNTKNNVGGMMKETGVKIKEVTKEKQEKIIQEIEKQKIKILDSVYKQVVFAYSVQGASHIREEKKSKNNGIIRKHPCQDRSFYGDFAETLADEKKDISLYVKNSDSEDCWVKLPVELKKHSVPFKCLCVSDGHGSSSYFRSDRGAELAIQSYVELLSERIEKLAECYKTEDFKTIEKGFSVGIARDRWTKKVVEDLITHPITEDELEILKENEAETARLYKQDYDSFCSIENDDGKLKFIHSSSLKEIYGCTFIAYVQTKDFWYAMQIGDGDFAISYNGDDFEKPIAEDPNCFANFTTSLCGKESYKDFRFAHGDVIPKYVFCSSDGISNSVQGDEGLYNLYKWFVEVFTNIEIDENKPSNYIDGKIEEAKKFIANDMSSQSERGSGDDFSLATILNFTKEDFDSANYKKYCDLLNAFKKELKTGSYNTTKEKQITTYFKRCGEKGKSKLEELYVSLVGCLRTELDKGSLIQELYDVIIKELDPKSEECLKIQSSYFEYVLNNLGRGNYDSKKFDEIILICKEDKNNSRKERAYKALFKYVKEIEKKENKILEPECEKIYEYFSKQNVDESTLEGLFDFLISKLLNCGINIENYYKYFKADSKKFGKLNFKLYEVLVDKDKEKANEYLEISAKDCAYLEASYFYAKMLFSLAEKHKKKKEISDARDYYITAKEYFEKSMKLGKTKNDLAQYFRIISDFLEKTSHQE